MDKEKIEFVINMKPRLEYDEYRQSVVELLTRPSLWHPIKRYRFRRDFDLRVYAVMAEYAGDLLAAIENQQAETVPETQTLT